MKDTKTKFSDNSTLNSSFHTQGELQDEDR